MIDVDVLIIIPLVLLCFGSILGALENLTEGYPGMGVFLLAVSIVTGSAAYRLLELVG